MAIPVALLDWLSAKYLKRFHDRGHHERHNNVVINDIFVDLLMPFHGGSR